MIIIYNAWTIKNNYISKPSTSNKLIALSLDLLTNLLLRLREAHPKYVLLSFKKNKFDLIVSLKDFQLKSYLLNMI